MFEAYSTREKKIVNVKDQYDAKEIFICPDPDCNGELKLKSIDGKKAKHFSCMPGLKKHSPECPYSISRDYTDEDHLVMYPLQSIMESAQNPNEKPTATEKSVIVNTKPRSTFYIRTPKQLLNFCLTQDLSTEYCDGQTINDIVVDHRNVGNGLYKGFNGARLVIGKTILFQADRINGDFILFQVRSHHSNRWLKAKVYVSAQLKEKISKYYRETYDNKFGGNNIAVLGDWKIDEKYNISCRVTHDRNVIMRFK